MKFKVGDKVTGKPDSSWREMKGTVIVVRGNVGLVGVKWNGFTGGHDCDGNLDSRDKSGWYVDPTKVELLKITNWKERLV